MNLEKLFKVYEFAKQTNKSRVQKWAIEPDYILHPINVARIAKAYNGDIATIHACLLHDVLNNTPVNINDIKYLFDKEIAFLVDGVTILETPEKTFGKVKSFSKEDKRVCLIKLADLIHHTLTTNSLGGTHLNYLQINPWYVALGKCFGYDPASNRLDELTQLLV